MIVELIRKLCALTIVIALSIHQLCKTLLFYGAAIITKLTQFSNEDTKYGKIPKLFFVTSLLCTLQIHGTTVIKVFRSCLQALNRHKNAVNFVICTLVMTVLIWYYVFLPLEERYSSAYIVRHGVNDSDQTQCHQNFVYNKETEKYRFPFMTDEDTQRILAPGNNIYFHLTNCIYDGVVEVNPRQACAVESAARVNSHLEVFLTFTSQVGLLNKTQLPIVDALLSYPNIHIRNIDIIKYAENTPAQEWVKEGKLYKSVHFKSHISDFLRFISINRWGGTYLDLDTIMLKNISLLGDNFCGAEDKNVVASAVINLNIKTEIGRRVADLCVTYCTQHFDPNSWGANGPILVSHVMQKLCNTSHTLEMSREKCQGFKVFDRSQFYAVGINEYQDAFDDRPGKLAFTMKILENSTLIHMSNKLSSNLRVEVDSPVAYGVLAELYCPKVYHSLGALF